MSAKIVNPLIIKNFAALAVAVVLVVGLKFIGRKAWEMGLTPEDS